jgi:hypothetical protein
MLERLRSLLGRPEPAGPQQRLRSFGPADRPITEERVCGHYRRSP